MEFLRDQGLHPTTLQNKGCVVASSGHLPLQSTPVHSEAIRLSPNDADAFYNRGYTYSHKGDHERAVGDYTASLALDTNNSRLWGQRCWSRAVVSKELREAIEDCDKANSLAPKIPQILGYRGLVYLKLGQFDKAVADYDAALALTKNPNNAEWLYGRGSPN